MGKKYVLIITLLLVITSITAGCSGFGNKKYSPETRNGQLIIINGNADNANVVLTFDNKTPYQSLFIEAGHSGAITEIPDGPYYLYYRSGNSSGRFDQMLEFVTTSDTYSIMTVTLYPVKGGNAKTSEVDEKDFPK
jgi:hypothetical protein